MIPDPFEHFRRAAALYLAQVEAELVERALSLPEEIARRAIGAATGAVVTEVQRVEAGIALLSRLPHHLADLLADSWRGFSARPLTARERLAIVDMFGYRARPELLRIVNGHGLCAIAWTAFRNGNPAITVGNTIYLNPAAKWPVRDLTVGKNGDSLELLIHETTHTIQYRELGYARFLARYTRDMRQVRGDANEMYRYWKRRRTFGDEMLEAQAQMVGNYSRLRDNFDPKLQARRDSLRRRLAGSGVDGL